MGTKIKQTEQGLFWYQNGTAERRTTKKERKTPKIKNVPYINSGLGEMKKEILSGNVIEK